MCKTIWQKSKIILSGWLDSAGEGFKAGASQTCLHLQSIKLSKYGGVTMSSQRDAQGGPVQSQSTTPFPLGSKSNVVSLAVQRWISNLSVTFPQTAHKYCPETIKPVRNALNHNEEPVTNAAFNYEVFMTCSWISRVKNEIEWNRTDV